MVQLNNAHSRLSAMLLLTTIFFMVEIVVGYITNSMALIADSFHMFSDAIALVIAFVSMRMSPKKWSKNTFGWARAEILGALINAVFLCALCVSILIESIKRFIKPDLIHDPLLLLIVGGLGLFINLIGLVLFKDHHHHHHHHHGHSHTNHHEHVVREDECKPEGGEQSLMPHLQGGGDSPKKKYGLLQKNRNQSISQENFFSSDTARNPQTPSPDQNIEGDNKKSDERKHNIEIHSDLNQSCSNTIIPCKLDKTEYKSQECDHHHRVDVHCLDGKRKEPSENKKRDYTSTQMNMHGVFLHLMADALGSVVVIISALVVLYTDWFIRLYIDPILSVFMVCLILKSTWPLLTESAMILLQTVPTHIEVDLLRRRLTQEIPGVLAVHEFHVWQLAGDRIIASAHIRCHNLQDYMRIAEKVKEFFHNEGIHSTTIQPEFIDFENEVFEDDNCVLDCPPTQRPHCAPQTCCGNQKASSGSEPTNTAPELCAGDNADGPTSVLLRRTKAYRSESNGDTTSGRSGNQDDPISTGGDDFHVVSATSV